MDLETLAKEINECYGEPFLPEGFVKARVTAYGSLWLDIGDRNGEFDENGEREGSGTNVGEGKQWYVSRLAKKVE